ncbi:hypothetical protein [Mycoplasma anserisalpingitidis]|uniref:hypothetical protein n=1 Tax=Mycoplasma anserisalpingitidis TaxID=519450 RepID=UPI0011B15320|nr:hypothetical protein [Mycoplasma anserisalpingitidis]QDY87760.1 hypothetical protein FOY45_02360 [Mycoplasma anserisalpingitidis]UCU26551.1 hypothetical protein K7D06_03055 [Mycoplasma anserisalpingitidis]UCU27388.1 hypothetical protein K9O38_03720 [Mycoplasma anserisalpingitidis]
MKNKNSLFYVRIITLVTSLIVIFILSTALILFKTVLNNIDIYNKSLSLFITTFILVLIIFLISIISSVFVAKTIKKLKNNFNLNNLINFYAESKYDISISKDVYNVLIWKKNKWIIILKTLLFVLTINWTVLFIISLIYSNLIINESSFSSDPLYYIFGWNVDLLINKFNLSTLIFIIFEITWLTIFNFINNKYKKCLDTVFDEINKKVVQYRENSSIRFE